MMRRYWIWLMIVSLLIAGFFVLAAGIERKYQKEITGNKQVLKLDDPVTDNDGQFRKINHSYSYKYNDLNICHLEGDEIQQGAIYARLYDSMLGKTSAHYNAMIYTNQYSSVLRWIYTQYLIIKWQQGKYVFPEPFKRLVAGLVSGMAMGYSITGSQYIQWLSLQAAYDLVSELGAKETFSGTGFMIDPSISPTQGRMIAGNLDMADGQFWDQQRLVYIIKPDNGWSYISVGWVGFFGAMAGINEKGVGVFLLPGKTQDQVSQGMPLPVLAVEILRRCESAESARKLIENTPVKAAGSFIIGSDQAGYVIEKSPQKVSVREAEKGLTVAADFFASAGGATDLRNKDWQRESQAPQRMQRIRAMAEIMTRPIGVEQAVGFLRDRRSVSGAELGLGNRLAVNSLSAIQSVVIDLGQKIMWVAAPPHQLGPYIPFSFDPWPNTIHEQDLLDADPLYRSEKYNEYLVYQQGQREAERLFRAKRYQEALGWLMEVRTMNREDFRSYFLAGKALKELGRWDEAIYNFTMAKRLRPDNFSARGEIETALRELSKKTAGEYK